MSLLGGEGNGGQAQGSGQATAPQGQGGTPAAAGSNSGGTNPPQAGTGQTSWRDSLPDDIKGEAMLAQIQDIPSLAKSYLHAQGLIGKKGVFPPGEKATDEEYAKFYDSIGRPPLDKYELAPPQGKEVDADDLKWLKETAYQNGMVPKQAQGLLAKWVERNEAKINEQKKAFSESQEKEIQSLKAEWGEGFDKQLSLANLAIKELGDQGFVDYLKKTGLANDVTLTKYLAKVGKALGEDKIRGEGGIKFGQTPQEIQAEINQITADTKGAYYDKTHRQHGDMVARVDALYKKLYASPKTA